MKNSHKIVLIGPGYPYRGGQSIFMSTLAMKLDKKFEIKFINYSLLYPKLFFPGTSQYDNSKDRKIFYPNKRLFNSINPFSWRKTAKYINNLNPNLIAIDWWHPFFGISKRVFIFFLKKDLQKKVIFITENIISHEANKIDLILTKIALSKANAFLALSSSVENNLKKLFNKKIFKSSLPIYNYYKNNNILNIDKKINKQSNDIVFMFFGLVRYYKGLDILIEAFAKLKQEHKNIKLLIVGEFYEKIEKYLLLIKKLNIQNQTFIFNQFIPDEEVASYFKTANIIVLPYRSGTQSGILSMSYGFQKPVIVTNVGELGKLVIHKKTGLVASNPVIDDIYYQMKKYIIIKQKNSIDFEKNIISYIEENDEFNKIPLIFNDMIRYLN